MQIGSVEHVPTFGLVGWCQNGQTWHAAQKTEVERTLVGGPIGTDNAGPVDSQGHIQFLYADVVDQLVIGSLQEGRVDCDHGLQAVAGGTSGESQRMLFGDTNVEVPGRVVLGKLHQPGTLAHRRRDSYQPLIAGCHIAQPVTEHLGVGALSLPLLHLAGGWVEGPDTVEGDRFALGRFEALAFLGYYVQETWTLHRFHVAQGRDQCVYIVAIDRADVVEAEFFEQRAWHHHTFEMFFPAPGKSLHRWCGAENCLAARPDSGIGTARKDSRKIVGHGADVPRNGHLVVI